MEQYNIDTIGERPWGTLDGRTLYVNDMKHEHASNVYWHLRQRNSRRRLLEIESLQNAIGHFIERKFGSILPYKPYYPEELVFLRQQDAIRMNGDIELDGFVIGNLTQVEIDKLDGKDVV